MTDHQNKSRTFALALAAKGWKLTHSIPHAAFVMLDLDILGRQKVIDQACAAGIPVFLYPHAARPPVLWDGVFNEDTRIKAHFVTSQGHIDVMERYGCKHKGIPVGWTYCDQLTYRATRARRVLFAPIHPNHNGWLSPLDKSLNQRTFERLNLLRLQGFIHLTVRYIRSLRHNGLEQMPGVVYTQGRTDLTFDSIDRADCVVAHQTFAYLSVARGCPTLMMGEDQAPRVGNSDESFRFVHSFEKYRDLLAYPLDILNTDDPLALIKRACTTDADIADWRSRIIGKPFDGPAFVKKLEAML